MISLNRQILFKMDTLNIQSHETYTMYKKQALDFLNWDRVTHPEEEYNLATLPKEHIQQWIQSGIDKIETSSTTRLKKMIMSKIFS